MRYLRIPYVYLTNMVVRDLYSLSHATLRIIYDIHNDIPNNRWHSKFAKAYLYHSSFLKWVFVKSKKEYSRRGYRTNLVLTEELSSIRSNPLSQFIPPTDIDLAADVVYILDLYSISKAKGGIPIPGCYVDLARRHYGYTVDKACIERVDDSSKHHRDNDRYWYYLQGEEASQVRDDSLGGSDRIRRYDAR